LRLIRLSLCLVFSDPGEVHFPCLTLAKLVGTRREATLMQEARAESITHVGGNPSATQRAIIEQAAHLRLRTDG
jgi:hypothetical protein